MDVNNQLGEYPRRLLSRKDLVYGLVPIQTALYTIYGVDRQVIYRHAALNYLAAIVAAASSLALMTCACRLPDGAGRDGRSPASIFHRKFSTPAQSIILMGAISLVGVLLVDFHQVVKLAGFCAFSVFVLVNCKAIVHYCIRRREQKEIQLFTNLLLPLTGAGIFIAIWLSFFLDEQSARYIWLWLGVVCLAFMTKGFSRPVMD